MMNIKRITVLLLILLIAAGFRFTGVNWDQNAHLHPDERFLTMVGNATRIPQTLHEYLDPARSTLNPTNVGYQFFVYGVFPLTLNTLIAVPLHKDDYSNFTIVGRVLSGMSDWITLIFVLLTAALLVKKLKLNFGLIVWSGLAYALMVLPIQLSHFFAMDTFVTLFMFGAFYFCLRFLFTGQWGWGIPGGVFFGLALASKLNSIYIAPLLGVMLLLRIVTTNKKDRLWKVMGAITVFGIMTYVSLRLGNPYTFESANWFNVTINAQLLESLKSLDTYSHTEAVMNLWYPPAVQWISKPAFTYAVKMLVVLGMGIGHTLFLPVGLITIFWHKKFRKYWWLWLVIFGWVGSVFLYQSVQFVKALRYFIFLYPFYALLIGIGANQILKTWYVQAIGLVILFIWPLMFLSIYIRPNTRVAASYWMYDHLPDHSKLLFEHWDDGLPVVPSLGIQKSFAGEQLPVFDQDTSEKMQLMNELLGANDYYILTSNRGWGSIPTVPEKYPLMSQFYNNLLAGKSYRKVAEFASYPSLEYLGIPLTLPDDWADETFTVYDHPKVLIYSLH